MSEYNCSICPFSTSSSWGMSSHARKHRNEYRRRFGVEPDSYADVRLALGEGDAPVATIGDFVDDQDGEKVNP